MNQKKSLKSDNTSENQEKKQVKIKKTIENQKKNK